MRNLAIVLAPLLLLALIIWGCGGGAGEAPTPSPALAAMEILDKCAEKMEVVDSFHIRMTQVGGTTPIAMGLEMSEATGDVARPDKLKGEVTATMMGFPVRVEVITVGNVTFVTNPVNGQWEPFPSEFSAAGIFDPATGIAGILRGMTNLSRLEDQEAVGLTCYHIKGQIASEDLRPITRLFTRSYVEGVEIATEIWLDKVDFLVRQMRLEGQITAEEKPGITRTITLSGYNISVEIKLPT